MNEPAISQYKSGLFITAFFIQRYKKILSLTIHPIVRYDKKAYLKQ